MSGRPPDRRGPGRAALLLLGLLALAVRLPGLSRSLWYDELVTVSSFSASPWQAWTRQVAANNHPAASLLVWAGSLALPEGEGWWRLPFALLGAAAAPALAWSAAGCGARRAGPLGGALLALGPGAVLLSQQLRGYAGLLLASALLPGLLGRLLDEPEPRRARRLGLALALTAGLGLASHLTLAIPLLLWTGLIACAHRLRLATLESQGRALLALLGGWALGLACWAPLLRRTFSWIGDALEDGDPGAGRAGVGPRELLLLLGGPGPAGQALAVLLLALVAPGLVALLARREPERADARRLGWILLAPLLALLALTVGGAPAYPRFLAVGLPALLLLAAAGLSRLAVRRQAVAGLALLALLALPALGDRAGRELQDMRGAARLARRLAGPQGHVVGEGFAGPLLTIYDPGLLPELGLDPPRRAQLEALLDDPTAPLAWIDPYPGLTLEGRARTERLRAALGPPLVLPGIVSDVVVYWRPGPG